MTEEPKCDIPEHGPTCEGNSLHIRRRDEQGCAQMQDGSWVTKASFVCQGPHLGLEGRRRPTYGEGDAVRDWLEASFDRVRP